MTNPVNKKTKEQFLKEIPINLGIEIIGEYINTDTKIEYRCSHGTHYSLPWQIKKFKYLFYCLRYKKQFRKWLWEKVREKQIIRDMHPDIISAMLLEKDIEDIQF